MERQNDELVTLKPLLKRVGNVQKFFDTEGDQLIEQRLADGQNMGRPLADEETLVQL